MPQSGLGDLFDLVHESIVVRSADGRLLSWNAASSELYGWSEGEVVGRAMADLFGEGSDTVEPILLSSGRWDGEVRRRNARGEELVIETRQSLRRDADGAPLAVVEIGRDITGRLAAERALNAAERRYTNLFQAMAASFWEIDFTPVGAMLRQLRKSGVADYAAYFREHPEFIREMMEASTIVDVNGETVRLFAAGDRERLRGSIAPYWPEASSGVYAQSVLAAVGGAPSFSTETTLRRADGSEFEALFTAAFPSESVAQGALLIGVIDISERKRAQRELEVREASYRYLFDYMPVSLWQIDSQPLAPFYMEARRAGVTDLDAHLQARPDIYEEMLCSLRCEGVNPRTLSLFGGDSSDQFIGPIDRFWRSQPDTLRRSMAARYAGASFHTEETRLLTLDGREIDVLYVITWPGGVQDGRYSIAGLVDITERVRAQAAERGLKEAFAHSARVSMLGELTASIAHEVNQPLAAIATNGSASLRWLGRDPPDVARAVGLTERIVADAQRAAEIIGGIRSMATKQATLDELVPVSALIQETAAFLQHDLQAHAVSLSLSVAGDGDIVRGDRTQLQQVFSNLVINAAQAMSQAASADRRIGISCETVEPDVVRITVADTGPGLAPEHLEHLFDSFFTTKASGMGMGLSICRSIIERHGGGISAANTTAGGAIFTVTLPRDQA